MTTIQLPFPREWSLQDVVRHLGVPASRILLSPMPGTAVEDDVLRVHQEQGRLCELIDGVLVEKAMGFHESILAGWVIHLLHQFLDGKHLGDVTAPDGPMRLTPGQVRMPDVGFVSRQREAECKTFGRPIPDIAPDLAVEVLSEKNTAAEIARKLKEYFFAGTRLAWVIDPRKRTVRVYAAPDESVTLDESGELTGEPVLPGLRIPVARVFEKTPRDLPRSKRKRKP